MKRLIIVLAAALLLPKLAGSAEFVRRVSAESIIENRAGLTVSVKRSSLSRRIERFAIRHGLAVDEARIKAEFLSYLDHPRVLAAIACRESGFDETAVGKLGEIGAFQQRAEIHGHPGTDFFSQAKSAERLVNNLVSEHRGKLFPAVKGYNGAGPAAVAYAGDVLSMAKSI